MNRDFRGKTLAEEYRQPPFTPPWWLSGPHAQTMGGKLFRRDPDISLQRSRIDTPDGDFLDLDFTPDPDPTSPLILLLHGLEGSSRRAYMLTAYAAMLAHGMAAVGLNFRSCSGEPNRTARLYHSGETEDMGFVLKTLSERFPGRPLGALGFSLGGNVLLKSLGESGEEASTALQAAAAISVPYDLAAGADMLELNFSCPHMTVEGSGMKVSHAFALVEEFTEIVREAVSIPIIAKLTPNITDINEPAAHAKSGGADAISTINTVSGLIGISLDDNTPLLNIFGKGAMSGFSGPAIKPIGLRCIAQLAQNEELALPLSGIGGIETWVDAIEYMLCGAATLQITTGVIHYGYRIIEDILEGMAYYLEDQKVDSLSQIVGKALPNIVPTDEFDLSRQGVAQYDLDRCVGCGQCYIVCQDAAGQCLSWDDANRRPVMDEGKCLSCMICSFVCPIGDPPLINYKEVKNKPEVIPMRSAPCRG